MITDGRSLDDKRRKISACDIPDIISRFHNLDAEKDRTRVEQSIVVLIDEMQLLFDSLMQEYFG